MLGSDTIQGKGMQFSEYFLQIFLLVMRPSHFSSPEIFPLRYLQQVAAALLEPQCSPVSHATSAVGNTAEMATSPPKATCCASIASSRRLSSFPASDGLKPGGAWKLV